MGDVDIRGTCAPAFERVRDAFEQNFALRREVGAAVAVWVDGDLVVNLWAARLTPPAPGRGARTRWPRCCPGPKA
ncbi:esterase/lipase LipP domain protein [Mycobacterium xenopi 3993]|nr:esterase/lipase LipP domain protein [Mycobacterium xenopi 3993]